MAKHLRGAHGRYPERSSGGFRIRGVENRVSCDEDAGPGRNGLSHVRHVDTTVDLNHGG